MTYELFIHKKVQQLQYISAHMVQTKNRANLYKPSKRRKYPKLSYQTIHSRLQMCHENATSVELVSVFSTMYYLCP
jgi:hypothetical protein